MKPSRIKRNIYYAALILLFSSAGTVFALDISLEPSHSERAVNQKTRVLIYANSADNLISMGVKVSFDVSKLQVVFAQKNTDFNTGFVMDPDGIAGGTQYTTPDVEIDNTGVSGEGSVIMIGGRLIGNNTTGLTGKVLLGWIDFQAVGQGLSYLTVDRGKYSPNHPTNTFDNFVKLNGNIDEPSNVPGILGSVYVGTDACQGDINGDGYINNVDLNLLRANYPKDCSTLPTGTLCVGDINGDGYVNNADLNLLRSQYPRSNTSCHKPTP